MLLRMIPTLMMWMWQRMIEQGRMMLGQTATPEEKETKMNLLTSNE